MARSIPPERFGQLIDAATATFIAVGYRRTQMADIAATLGLAKGTLYGYVESKEALFDAAVRYADGRLPLPLPEALPLPTPKARATVGYVRKRLAAESSDLTLVRVLAADEPPADAHAELAAIVVDLYRRISGNRRVLKLIDRCAVDFPDLAKVWFGEGRFAQHQLLQRYLEQRIEQRRFRRLANIPIAARIILETVAFWAMHRHHDPSPQVVDESDVENAIVDLLARGLLQVRR